MGKSTINCYISYFKLPEGIFPYHLPKKSVAWPLLQRLPMPQCQHFAQPELVNPIAGTNLAAGFEGVISSQKKIGFWVI